VHLALFVTEDRHKYERELLLERKRAEELARSQEEAQRENCRARASSLRPPWRRRRTARCSPSR
jgi:hypothetical protein